MQRYIRRRKTLISIILEHIQLHQRICLLLKVSVLNVTCSAKFDIFLILININIIYWYLHTIILIMIFLGTDTYFFKNKIWVGEFEILIAKY